jgi:diguanylate cyclase (GGDEF)-like protein
VVTQPESGETGVGWRAAHRDLEMVLGLGLLALVGVAAFILLIRQSGQAWSVDDRLVALGEVTLALACLGRALTDRPRRLLSAVLGASLLAWALGGIAGIPGTSTVSLLFYPLALGALVLLAREECGQIDRARWLDAAIASIGAAAIGSAFVLDTIVRVGGDTNPVAVTLASSISACVLLALALGVVVMVPHPGRALIFAGGCALIAIGNFVALRHLSSGIHQAGLALELLWLAALLMLTGSIWLRLAGGPRSPLLEKAPRVSILVAVVAACPAILVLGNFRHVSPVALGLAGATLIVVAARMALSLREQRALNETRQRDAVTDELTGLGNRRCLLDELNRALAPLAAGDPQAGSLALLLIDLDHFKEINDSFGHQTGDALLREIGPRIRQVVRRSDLVARLGGDEFAVVLHGADAYKATTVAQRITTLLEQPIDVSSASLHVGASIGVALAPDHALSADDLIRCADIAMYRAKSERGSFDVYEMVLDDESDRFALIEDLRVAMDNGSLALHYQPAIDLRTGAVVAVEALLRWPHPTLGLIPPEHLLALAEESGLIHTLAAWVFEEAVADCSRWWHEGHQAAVAVNLLATDLLDSSLPRRVGELLDRAGLPTEALILEITEGMVVADLTRSKRVIQSLTDSGILVSIDDFGTGFSSISHLNDLAVGELKLDRTFTSRLQVEETGGREEDIVRSIIDLGHALGLRVVAEGIERLDFVGVLAALGCDSGQGYAIQAPCPAGEINFAGLDRTNESTAVTRIRRP